MLANRREGEFLVTSALTLVIKQPVINQGLPVIRVPWSLLPSETSLAFSGSLPP